MGLLLSLLMYLNIYRFRTNIALYLNQKKNINLSKEKSLVHLVKNVYFLGGLRTQKKL